VDDKEEFDRQVRRTAVMSVALAAALVFGSIVLAGGDWIPGGIIVAATVIGLSQQIATIRRLCCEPAGPFSPSSHSTR
jgi:hypothetical protein